jgi:ABC-type cobalamin/Fe3+-siderophores transport system ATPase subunit
MAILFVTHDFNLLPKCMARAVFMNHGKVVFDGGVDDALTGPMLSRLFEYPLETFERNGRRFVSFG